ncbi:hypothetical protein FACS1894211_10180 [Clostridia bacterium]|nr:hypothetical protein FACS1894211_10180 [Clostridia bacterium]
MSNKLKATLAGVGASLGGVALWIVLSLVGFIAGIAGALMGVLFIFVYKKLNKDDQTKYPFIVACVLILVEIVIAELLTIAFLAAANGVSFGAVMNIDNNKTLILIDILVGLALGYLVFGGYLFSLKRKNQMQNLRQPGVPDAYQNPNGDPNANGNPDQPAPYGQNPDQPAAQPQSPDAEPDQHEPK